MTVASRAVTMAVMADVKTSESDEMLVGQWVVAVGQVGDTVVVAVEMCAPGQKSVNQEYSYSYIR